MFSTQAFSGYSVLNQEEAKEFYENVLGLTVDDTEMGLGLKFESGQSVFLYPKEDHQPATFTVLNFPVLDIKVAVELLKKRGVTMEMYDMPDGQDELGIMHGKEANMGPDIAWFKDPSGNILAVLEE